MNPPRCHQCGALLPHHDPHTTICRFCGAPLAPAGDLGEGRIPLTDDAILGFMRGKLTGADSTFLHPSIPEKKLATVRKIHAQHLPPGETILALYDGTAFGSASDGFLVTSRRICFKNQMEPAQFLEWVHVDEDDIYADEQQLVLGRAKVETLYSEDDTDLYTWSEVFETLSRSARPPKPKPERPADAWSGAGAGGGGAAAQTGGAWGGMAGPPSARDVQLRFPEQPEEERFAHAPYQVDRGCAIVDVHPSSEVMLAAGGEAIEIRFAQNGARAARLTPPDGVLTARFSPDGAWIIAGGMDNRVTLYEARTGQPRGATPEMDDYVDEVAWLGRSSLFVMASQGGQVWVADAQTMQPTLRLLETDPEHESLGGIAVTPDGARLFVSVGERLGGFDLVAGSNVWRRDSALLNASRLAVSPRGDLLLSAGRDGIATFDARTGYAGPCLQFRCARGVSWPDGPGGLFKKAEDGTYSWSPRPRFSPSGHAVAVQDLVGNLNIYDVTTGQLHPMGRDRGRAWIEDLAWFPDGEHLLVGSSDNTVSVWRARPLVGVLHVEAIGP